MPSLELTVANILNIARISQYLATNSISASNNFKGRATTENLAVMIYCERRAVQIRYDQNPADPTLIATANYLYALLGRFGILAQSRTVSLSVAPPIISGPTNQTVNVGQTAIFSTTVISSVPYTVQWYDVNNNPIAGATSTSLSIINAQLSQSGTTYYMKATNSSAVVSSTIAVLVVNQIIQGFYYYGATDFSTQLLAGSDVVPYLGTFPITHNQPISILLPVAAENTFMVFKYPSTENIKTTYSNLPLNVGNIPSIAWNAIVTFGGWNYIFSRTGNTFGLNPVNPIVFT